MSSGNPAERLDSWKEIAVYLRRDVRTVQRWEKKEGLPVHRHQHDKLGSVYAFPAELTQWFTTRQQTSPAVVSAQKEPDRIKLAVLPFGDLGNGSESTYFGEGLTEEMITELTRLAPSELAVIARSTAGHYNESSNSLAQMKEDLGVDYALQGKVRKFGNRVRITAQLSEVQDQTQLWAETYERDLSDVLAVQAEIAQAIAREIGLALNLSESKRLAEMQQGQARVEPAAYDAYLRARYHLHEMTPSGISRSIEDFERAISADPNYAPAHAGLAGAYALLAIAPFDLKPPREVMPKAEAAARRALELDNTLAEAHCALALVDHHYHWKWDTAEAGYRRAIELNPGYAAAHLWYSWLLLALGRRVEAMKEIDETMLLVQETDPHRLVAVHATRAQAFYFAREFQRAVKECEKALHLDPNHFMLHYILGRSYMRLGQTEKAIAHFKSASATPGEVPLIDAALGLAYAVSGNRQGAQEVADGLKDALTHRYVPPTYFGMLYAGLGDTKRAVAWLKKALAERADGLTWLGVDPMLDGLRQEPGFQELLQQIGLPE